MHSVVHCSHCIYLPTGLVPFLRKCKIFHDENFMKMPAQHQFHYCLYSVEHSQIYERPIVKDNDSLCAETSNELTLSVRTTRPEKCDIFSQRYQS